MWLLLTAPNKVIVNDFNLSRSITKIKNMPLESIISQHTSMWETPKFYFLSNIDFFLKSNIKVFFKFESHYNVEYRWVYFNTRFEG